MVVGRLVDGACTFGLQQRRQQRRDAPPRRDAPRYPADAIGLPRNRCPATRRLETTPPVPSTDRSYTLSFAPFSPRSFFTSSFSFSSFRLRVRRLSLSFRFLGGAAISINRCILLYYVYWLLSFDYISEIALFIFLLLFFFLRILLNFDRLRVIFFFPALKCNARKLLKQ